MDDVAGLYRGPLSGFVARRAELARGLRAAGDREGAAAVAGLRRPPISAWAVDQLAAEAPELVADLLAAAADAIEAQRAAAAGSGDGGALQDASARLRSVVEEATGEALRILERSGGGTSETVTRRIRTTLQAASTTGPVERSALWRGVLDRDLDPPGFGVPGATAADDPEVTAAIAPRRGRRLRSVPEPARRARRSDTVVALDVAAVRAAEREAAERRRAAQGAAETAHRRREHAERLATEAAAAAAAAETAERDAEAAAGRAARAQADVDALRRGSG